MDLASGQPAKGWDCSATFAVTKPENEGQPDDVLVTALGVIHVLSRRLRHALDGAGIGGVQYLPVRVTHLDGSEETGYSIANVLNVLPALDRRLSLVDVYPDDYFLPERRGEIAGLRRPVLLGSLLEKVDIIRLEEFPASVYVSQGFVTVIEEGGFTGCTFAQVEVSFGGD